VAGLGARLPHGMPALVCGLDCFALPAATTAGEAARAFAASFHPGLPDNASSIASIEVYRLERLAAPDALLAAEELVLCRVPNWSFDLAGLEALHAQLDELREAHEELRIQHERTKEAFLALSSGASAVGTGGSEASPTSSRMTHLLQEASTNSFGSLLSPGGGASLQDPAQEVLRLRQKLAQSEQTQQETKNTVIALRQEFMHLVQMWGGGDTLEPKPFAGPGGALLAEGGPYSALASELLVGDEGAAGGPGYGLDGRPAYAQGGAPLLGQPGRGAGSPQPTWAERLAGRPLRAGGPPVRHVGTAPAAQGVRARSAGRRGSARAGTGPAGRRPTS